MIVPIDGRLARNGLPAAGNARTLVIACGALAHEITALKRLNGWSHLDLACLPAIWHNHPERIVPGVEEAVRHHRTAYDTVLVAYGDCGTGGKLAQTCATLGVEMIAAPHCYAFYEGADRFAAHPEEIAAFYLTDFLARQFDAFVWRPLGLDRCPELVQSYFGNYEKLVYLAQTRDRALNARARDCATRLGLTYERRLTGYGDLPAFLAPRD
ncbi:uncharacterized protein DUF1638 [Rhodovulum bhavnagarense]|uniref:Uncharacterized protein DUF1638 n=1 Tax=Rhodovulum bhavnagarense TaxID=992286 RepID=A0A4R2RD14_9RHOB|nr:DUF1638 domain-containing protein [Rhodovulum bhavnagarense]TCP61302.1 uncharacterized protein DUF1638 [Rhodovulum bhavnagarense]